jgi:hypothetical protein
MAGFQPHRNDTVSTTVLKQVYGQNTIGKWIGPFSPELFMSRLMQIPEETTHKMSGGVKFKAPKKGQLRKNMYNSFVRLYCVIMFVYCDTFTEMNMPYMIGF